MEYVKTNVLGTENVIRASLASEVERMVVLSTDKAVSPLGLYGATKLCAEKLAVAANTGAMKNEPKDKIVGRSFG